MGALVHQFPSTEYLPSPLLQPVFYGDDVWQNQCCTKEMQGHLVKIIILKAGIYSIYKDLVYIKRTFGSKLSFPPSMPRRTFLSWGSSLECLPHGLLIGSSVAVSQRKVKTYLF